MKLNKILLLSIPALLLSSCGKDEESLFKTETREDGTVLVDEGFTEGNTVQGHKAYYAQNAHNHINCYNIPDSDIVFCDANSTEYSYLLKDKNEPNSAKFATYTQGHIFSATGASVPIKYGSECTENDKYIVVNNAELMNKFGVEVDTSLALKHGYTINRKGSLIFVYAANSECVQLCSIKFLSTLVGYDCLGNSTYIYEKDGKKITKGQKIMVPDYNLKEIPDGQTRVKGMGISTSDVYDMGYSEISDLIPVKGRNWHNCLNILPVETYSKDHPDWYSADLKQICYTAHGNEAEVDAMVDIVYKAIVEAVNEPAYKNHYRTGFFQSDGADLCQCDACKEAAAYYGDGDKGQIKANSAVMIKFINKVAAKFYEDPKIKGTDRENVYLGIFAYEDSCQAPISHIDEVQVDPRVTVYIAPARLGGIPVSWLVPFLPEYGGIQAAQYQNLKDWGKVTQNTGFWGYSLLFQNYMIPYCAFESMVEDARVVFDSGAQWVEFQNEYTQEGHTGFNMFKNYINSKTWIDVNLEYNDIKNTFFNNFYGDAGNILRQFFDELEEINRYLIKENLLTGYMSENPSNPAALYSFEVIKHFADMIDNALATIYPLSLSDINYYNKIKTNIEYEAIWVHYFLTVYYESRLNAEMTAKYRQMLYNECCDTKFTYFNEGSSDGGNTLFVTLFADWGF